MHSSTKCCVPVVPPLSPVVHNKAMSHEAVKFNDHANPVAASEHPFHKSVLGNSGSAFCSPILIRCQIFEFDALAAMQA